MNADHFFIVGAQRSGTTYLYQILDEHPEIEMAKPVRPEPKFFLRPDLHSLTRDDYLRRFFDPAAPGRLRGEKSTSYIESEYAARHIAAWFPDAKIIFLLRDPIARALSNYHFSRKNGFETLPLEQAITTEGERRDQYDRAKVSTSPYAYLQRGRYIEYMQLYARYFDPQNLLILIHEEVMGQAAAISDLYARLGVDAAFSPPSLHQHINSGHEEAVHPLSPALEQYMRACFAEPTAQLEALLGRRITAWIR